MPRPRKTESQTAAIAQPETKKIIINSRGREYTYNAEGQKCTKVSINGKKQLVPFDIPVGVELPVYHALRPMIEFDAGVTHKNPNEKLHNEQRS